MVSGGSSSSSRDPSTCDRVESGSLPVATGKGVRGYGTMLDVLAKSLHRRDRGGSAMFKGKGFTYSSSTTGPPSGEHCANMVGDDGTGGPLKEGEVRKDIDARRNSGSLPDGTGRQFMESVCSSLEDEASMPIWKASFPSSHISISSKSSTFHL
ncbi:hypothetical protein AMTR_s00161p00036410 [Amborella trichopoda]|uniref:Uncharacterized protein n=1 Tax=Amborella trichopoda TaxID=13333 RepID=W1PKE7_AMBTC|nr:hypothetical protein AMTR_s00161p00036410 [Amborella trichopoda]